jgi:hypothetical protein
MAVDPQTLFQIISRQSPLQRVHVPIPQLKCQGFQTPTHGIKYHQYVSYHCSCIPPQTGNMRI